MGMIEKEIDFSKGIIGAIFPLPPEKKCVTIRLDNDIIEWFLKRVENNGGGSYQTMINDVLNKYIDKKEQK